MKQVSMNKKSHMEIEIPIHEVLLSFNNDTGAEAFHDWWDSNGLDEFSKWCSKDEYYKSETE